MKVAILSLYSGHLERGVEVWAESLKKSLAGDCDICVFGNKTVPIDWNQSDSRGKFSRNFFLDYWSLLVLRFTTSSLRELYAYNPDIIIPTNGGWQVLLLRVITFVFNKKMIVVGHSGIGREELWNLFCFPDVFVSLTSFSARWAKKRNPFVRVETIPNGVWMTEFTTRGKKANVSLDRPVYLYVGALERGKRPLLAIEAVSRLKKGSLLMLGQGDKVYEQEIDHLANELLGRRFSRKTVPHNKIADYYRYADVFTLPTWHNEAFGMVYLEAMACGLPVVATDDLIKREIIGSAGVFVDPTNIIKYSEALEKCATANWGDKPVNQASRFSWEKVSRKYLALFKNLT